MDLTSTVKCRGPLQCCRKQRVRSWIVESEEEDRLQFQALVLVFLKLLDYYTEFYSQEMQTCARNSPFIPLPKTSPYCLDIQLFCVNECHVTSVIGQWQHSAMGCFETSLYSSKDRELTYKYFPTRAHRPAVTLSTALFML
jgi:hypothetical protein